MAKGLVILMEKNLSTKNQCSPNYLRSSAGSLYFSLFWVEDGNFWDWVKILSQARELLLQQVWSWQLDHHHRLQAGHCRVNSDILPNQLASKEWMRFANLVYSSLHHYKIDLLYHFKQPGGVVEAESRQGLHPDHLCRALLWQLRWVQPWS